MSNTCAPSSRLILLVILCFLIFPPVVWGGAGTDHLAAGELLNADEYLTVLEGERILKMEDDGNLALYGSSFQLKLWQSGTVGNRMMFSSHRKCCDSNNISSIPALTHRNQSRTYCPMLTEPAPCSSNRAIQSTGIKMTKSWACLTGQLTIKVTC